MDANLRSDFRSIKILVCALGGEGGGVLAEWLVEAALHSGHIAQSTSIPGVAQRTGATTYYIEVFSRPDAELGGRRPVFGLSPVPGSLDLIVSSELLETVRQLGLGMGDPQRSLVISGRGRALTITEKMQPADGRVPVPLLEQVVRTHSRDALLLDMDALARRAGTVVSAVLFGAIAGSGVLPFDDEAYRRAVRAGGKGVEPSLRGFDAARLAVSAWRGERAALQQAIAAALPVLEAPPQAAATVLPWDDFPASTHEIVTLGHARVLEYQDAAYAALYLARLRRVLAAERAGDAAGQGGFATTRETARHLALWMAYEDVVRVAELKSRASRFARVRREVGAGEGELLRIYDHFKPGVPELAGLLPGPLAQALLRWDRRRNAQGKPAWSLPLKLPTHTLPGLAALRALAALKRLRRSSSRYALEQQGIEQWLAAVERGARQHAALGREIADCGRLIKGYGSTNERGKDNLLHVLRHLAPDEHEAGAVPDPAARAAAIARLRQAALADASGAALDQALLQSGAPARPVQAQPIRWVRQRPGGRSGGPSMGATPSEDQAALSRKAVR
jgi:indolepyruvate ferredoxin oxidoreductase beta subunit